MSLLVPKRGSKLELTRLAHKNAVEETERAISKEERQSQLMQLLGSMLGLKQTPSRIEAYDISNTGSADIVGAMTVFVDGKPQKKSYRRFRLKGLEWTRRLRLYGSGADQAIPPLSGPRREI